MAASRWIIPEVYPLFAATGAVVSFASFSLIRNITSNPEVKVTKENRALGVRENFAEGEKYAHHGLKNYLRGRRPEIMPNLNKYFTSSKE